jgi:hypothetical protein
MAKGKKTGGRSKGTKNKHTFQAEEVANRLDIDPLAILLYAANGDWKALGYEAECYFSENPEGQVKMGYVISPETRINAAKEACKYLYTQNKTVQHSGTVTLEDIVAGSKEGKDE